MKSSLSILLLVIFVLLSFNSRADEYPDRYPFKFEGYNYIHNRVMFVSEDKEILKNIFKIQEHGLQSSKVKSQPWTSSYWPMNKGLIAYEYPNSQFERFIDWTLRAPRSLSWSANLRRINKSFNKLKKGWIKLDNEELELLSPAAKYDILLGDDTFDLTSKVITYVNDWAKFENQNTLNLDYQKEQLVQAIKDELIKNGEFQDEDKALEEANNIYIEKKDNYVLKKEDQYVPIWEGICNGWAPAATVVPRPNRYVDFELENGRTLRFFPEDIKALISYAWSNSEIQNWKTFNPSPDNKDIGGVYFEGNACKKDNPKRDEWERNYDEDLNYKCTGVHPAIWHLSLINIIGKQKRSFIVDVDIVSKKNNHPISDYKIEYFNPYTGDYTNFNNAIVDLSEKDQFKSFRNPQTKKLIGVKLSVQYIHYDSPKRDLYNSAEKDKTFTREMLYDLELDNEGVIIGGQWRTTEVGKPLFRANRNQPDFFWVITKDWKSFFKDKYLTYWDKKSTAPKSFIKEAKTLHKSFNDRFNDCTYRNKETGKMYFLTCKMSVLRPKLLPNILNTLLEKSTN